jgi:hypothetical protein
MKLLQNKPNVDGVTVEYPYGSMRDDTGGDNGSRANTEFMTDYVQTFEKLVDESGITANGLPDNVTNGFQIYEALRTLFPCRQSVIDIGFWDMDATASISVAHGIADFTKIRDVVAVIVNDAGTFLAKLSDGEGSAALWDATDITLSRVASGFFNGIGYDDGAINRGFVTISYID